MRVADEAPLCLIAVTSGEAWLLPEDGEGQRLGPGDVAVTRGPDPYTVSDDPRTDPQVLILPGQKCVTPDGQQVELMSYMGVRTWGNSPVGSTVMLNGTYEHEGEVSRRLLGALPPVLVLQADAWESPLVGLLADEMLREDPGQEAVLDRLLDLLLIAVLRAWFARPDAEPPAWYRAYSDPVVGRALRLIHSDPAHSWTVAELAAEAGVSRAALARRFTELVGEPPMTFLTDWRLSLAADLLLEPAATVGSVAHQVGYGSPFALSTAFKRVRGVSPQQYKLAAAVG
jgi:AraC-like DNA-binding protein